MSLRKRLLPVLLCVLLIIGLAACAPSQKPAASSENPAKTNEPATPAPEQTAENKFADRVKFSATSINLPENVSFMEDDIYKTFDSMFNFEYELINITWENWDSQARIWVNSGDMPDMMFWNFNLKDYNDYKEQDLIKALPKDYAQKYPNLAKAVGNTGIGGYLQSKDADNSLYMIPNVIYLVPPTKTTTDALDGRVLYYRKDWAKSVGITVGETITNDQIAALAQAFMDKDPGGNGSGKTVGFTAAPANVNHTFVQVYNTFFDQFHKTGGKYVWGGFEPSTLEGIKNLKKYYDMGFIDKDYFTFKSKEHYDKFDSGLAGMFVDGAGAQNVNERFVAFARSNPTIKANDAIGLATVVGPDNKFHGQSYMNYWAGLIFNPKIDDAKLNRILNILDYTCTQQGQRLIFAGIEGRDYTMNGDQITITREKDKDGNFKYIGDLYPSYNFFFTKAVLPDDWSSRDPSLPAEARDSAVNMFLVKEKNMDIVALDYDALLFAGEKKLKFSVNLSDAITNMILSGKDIDSQWNEFVAQNQDAVNGVLDEMNAALAK